MAKRLEVRLLPNWAQADNPDGAILPPGATAQLLAKYYAYAWVGLRLKSGDAGVSDLRRRLPAVVATLEAEYDHATHTPSAGLTFSVKDIFDVAGSRTGFGQPAWLESHPPAASTAPAVASLLGAGARLVGRTICDELTYSLTGQNVHYGTPVNPRCPDRLPGGSSSGAGSAVAGGLCDVGLGSDCAGSVRIPASYCGIYGMRPTHGRIPVDGVCPFAPSFDTVGWMAREAGVLARTGNILLAGTADAGLPGSVTTIIVARDAFQLAGPSAERSLAASVARLCDAVGQSREITVSGEEEVKVESKAEVRVRGKTIHLN